MRSTFVICILVFCAWGCSENPPTKASERLGGTTVLLPSGQDVWISKPLRDSRGSTSHLTLDGEEFILSLSTSVRSDSGYLMYSRRLFDSNGKLVAERIKGAILENSLRPDGLVGWTTDKVGQETFFEGQYQQDGKAHLSYRWTGPDFDRRFKTQPFSESELRDPIWNRSLYRKLVHTLGLYRTEELVDNPSIYLMVAVSETDEFQRLVTSTIAGSDLEGVLENASRCPNWLTFLSGAFAKHACRGMFVPGPAQPALAVACVAGTGISVTCFVVAALEAGEEFLDGPEYGPPPPPPDQSSDS